MTEQDSSTPSLQRHPGKGAGRGLEAQVTSAPRVDGDRFRRRWAKAERRVCCLDVAIAGGVSGGTGFLVGPDLVMTSAHVVAPAPGEPPMSSSRITARFDFHLNPAEGAGERRVALVESDWLVKARKPSQFDAGDRGGLPEATDLDYAILRLAEPVGTQDDRGWYTLEDFKPPPADTWLTIVQHPALGPLASAFDASGVIGPNRNASRLRHRVSTEKGSSGSPCFDAHWNLVALHQAGHPEGRIPGRAKYNQAIPIGLIRQDLESEGLWPLTQERSAEPTVTLPYDRFKPTVLVLGSDVEAQIEALRAEGEQEPTFAVWAGEEIPEDLGDNTVGVFLAGEGEADPRALETLAAVQARGIQVIPVVEDLDRFQQQAPEALRELNGTPWARSAAATVPRALCQRIRQRLGLRIDPEERSIFISYSRRDLDEAQVLAAELRERGFEVFLDVEDLPVGEPVQERIEEQINGRSCLLYLETPNATDSDWIHDELTWAYNLGLAMAIVRRGDIDDPFEHVATLPRRHADPETPIAEVVDQLGPWIDTLIAEANTRRRQMTRSLRAILEDHPRTSTDRVAVAVEQGTAVFTNQVLGREHQRKLLFRSTPHRPSAELVSNLAAQQSKDGFEAAVLLYEASNKPLKARQIERLAKASPDGLVVWIERQAMREQLGQLVEYLT